MRRPLLLLPLTALATLFSAGAAGAAEWHDVEPGSGARQAASLIAPDARGAALSYLKAASAELRIDGVELSVQSDLAVGDHHTVRFTQSYAGLPVLGAAVAVHVKPNHEVRAALVDVARGLSVSPVPSIVAERAIQAVEASLGVTFASLPGASLAVLPEEEGPGHLVWIIDVPSAKGGERFLVDAHDGAIVRRQELARDVRGRVYPISSANTPDPKDLELPDLVMATPQKLTGWNGNLAVTNYVSGGAMGDGNDNLVLDQSLVPNVGTDFLYNPPADPLDPKDAFAQVGIYYHVTRMRDYFTNTHHLDMSDPKWKVTAVANMEDNGKPLDNAFFAPEPVGAPWNSPNLIAIGQGSEFDFSDDSDVFLHEFTHYVAHNAIGYNEQGQLATTEYGLSPWAGSIDEGTADYFACTVNGDPVVGEASLARLGAERNLSKTTKKCPDDMIGEVHDDGELIGSLSWSVRTAFGKDIGDQLIWGTLTMLTPGITFGDFGRALKMMGQELATKGVLKASDLQTLDSLVASRGLDDCDAVLALDGGKSRKTKMFGFDILSQVTGQSCGSLRGAGVTLQSLFHYKATPASTDGGIRFSVDLQTLGGGDDLQWNLYVRTGQHVGFSSTIGGFLPKATKFDYKVEKITATHGEIVIDSKSNPPFDPSKTYYLAVTHANCPATVATVSSDAVKLEPEGQGGAGGQAPSPKPPTHDTPKSESANETNGCACRAAGSSAESTPWAALSGVLLLGAGAVLRRSRRS